MSTALNPFSPETACPTGTQTLEHKCLLSARKDEFAAVPSVGVNANVFPNSALVGD